MLDMSPLTIQSRGRSPSSQFLEEARQTEKDVVTTRCDGWRRKEVQYFNL